MARRAARVRNVHAILALSAGLVLLVLGTFGWMGWMVLGDARRREDVAKVLERSALEASADQIVASFRRNVVEQRAALRALRASSLPTPPAAGTKRHPHHGRLSIELTTPRLEFPYQSCTRSVRIEKRIEVSAPRNPAIAAQINVTCHSLG